MAGSMYQGGSAIGAVVGPAADSDDAPGTAREVLGPDTEHGQALLLAAIGVVLLILTVGRSARGLLGKVGAALEMIVVVAAAMWVANYAGRTYATLHPNGPLAAGVRFDS